MGTYKWKYPVPPSEKEACQKDPEHICDLITDYEAEKLNAYGIIRCWYEEEDGEAFVYVTTWDSCD